MKKKKSAQISKKIKKMLVSILGFYQKRLPPLWKSPPAKLPPPPVLQRSMPKSLLPWPKPPVNSLPSSHAELPPVPQPKPLPDLSANALGIAAGNTAESI